MKKILDCDNPMLRKKAKPVAQVTPWINEVVKEMIESLKNSKPKGIGLAAPQIGELLRIIIVHVGEGILVMINPRILSSEGECLFKEGCLSIPGLFANISRPKKIKVRCLNLKGDPVTLDADDVLARVILHEIDHLDGKLFTDYIEPGQEIDLEDDAKMPESLERRLSSNN